MAWLTDYPREKVNWHPTVDLTKCGCSYEERAGFQKINLKVDADFDNATREEVNSWLKETEARCPVTDNLRYSAKINVINELKE